MKIWKKFLLALFALFIIIQFIRPERNIKTGVSANDISTMYPVSTQVHTILDKACNDCHSNNTRYPWYSNIQPAAWWLDDHIQEGKRDLNFSEFKTYRLRKQYRRMDDIVELVKNGEMPLSSYTLIHKDAVLSEAEKGTLINWANSIATTMEAKYPKDSLIAKK